MVVPLSIEPVEISGSRVKVAFGPGNLMQLGRIAKGLGANRVLLVSDPGIVAAGHAQRAMRSLQDAGVGAELFSDVGENPTSAHVAAGVEIARARKIDLIVGLGGGSAMDCAKGISFVLPNGGEIFDYIHVDMSNRPALPLIAVPTTAGTGSDAQSFAIITDPATHRKLACGDRSAFPKVAILDPDLTATQPSGVAAAVGIDAISHAVESSASKRRNAVSREFSKAAWDLLESSYERSMSDPADAANRGRMLVGAHLAGAAIENSMLGAAHSLANALTAEFGMVHGVAVGMMLPHVVRFNSAAGDNPYSDLAADAGVLARRLDQLLAIGGLPRRLGECGVEQESISRLAPIAATQWTATFNPRPVGEAELSEILRHALRSGFKTSRGRCLRLKSPGGVAPGSPYFFQYYSSSLLPVDFIRGAPPRGRF